MSKHFALVLVSLSLLASGSVGCYSDRPHEYGRQRPPVDQLDDRDRGLQSKDVVAATDQLAADLCALPEVNLSPTQLTVVVTNVENYTQEPRFNYDIFTERLRVNIARMGRGKLAIIENRDRLANIQSRELDSAPNTDKFGQGGRPPSSGGPGGIQPEYTLYGKIYDMPNRATNYYLATFQLTNLRTRQITWTGQYEVKVER
jgi:hypothetical protein